MPLFTKTRKTKRQLFGGTYAQKKPRYTLRVRRDSQDDSAYEVGVVKNGLTMRVLHGARSKASARSMGKEYIGKLKYEAGE